MIGGIMNKIKSLIFAFVFSILFLGNISAHVTLLYPIGGESFQVGEVIMIQWYPAINHGPADWDLYFSEDGGSTWQSIAMNLPQSQLDYSWTVPNVATDSGQVKVVQDNSTGMDYSDASGNFAISTTTGIKEPNSYAENFVLYPAYPNPFNPKTTIRYELPKSSIVKIEVFDVFGQSVVTLVDKRKPAGYHTVDFDGSNLASGIYLYRIQASDFVHVKKMVLMK